MTIAVAWSFLGLCTIAAIVAGLSRNRVPVAASIVIGAALRVAFAALVSRGYTPADVAASFRKTGELFLRGQDPVHHLGREWNFLELMPLVHAIELRSGLPWVYAVKIAPILADLVLIWLVARFATRDGRTRALQYAVNPLSLLIVSLHGQVEPVTLALALSGVLLIRRGRPALGGVLLGAAVAAKTWPVVVLLAVLPLRDRAKTVQILAGSVIVPASCLLFGIVVLDFQPGTDIGHILSYGSLVDWWTWSALMIELGHREFVGYESPLGRLGTVLIAAGVGATLTLLRRSPPEVRVLGVLCGALAVTAGFGPQYLLWVLPLMVALSGPIRSLYMIASTGWAAIFYLSPLSNAPASLGYLRGLSWLVAALLAAALIEQIRLRPAAPTALQIPVASPAGGRGRTSDPAR